MFSPRNRKLLVVLMLLFLLSLACNMPGSDPTPTDDPGLLYTVAAQTLEAQMTQNASGDSPPTQPSAPTATSQPPVVVTNTVPPTQPQPSNTPTPLCRQGSVLSPSG